MWLERGRLKGRVLVSHGFKLEALITQEFAKLRSKWERNVSPDYQRRDSQETAGRGSVFFWRIRTK